MSRPFDTRDLAAEYAQALANAERRWFRIERCTLDGQWVVHSVPRPDRQFGRDLTDGELISPEKSQGPGPGVDTSG